MKRPVHSVSSSAASILALGISWFLSAELDAQSSPNRLGYRETSLFVEAGVGRLAVRGRAVSSERYVGSPDYIAVDWTKLGDSRGFHLGFLLEHGSEIAQGNLSANIVLTSINIDYLYRVASFSLFSRPALLFLGPSTGTHVYIREQNVANRSEEVVSIAFTLPIGLVSKLAVPFGRRFALIADVDIDVFSLGLRYPSNGEDDFDGRLLHVINGFVGGLDLRARYRLGSKFAASLVVRQRANSITAWDESLLVGGASVGIALGVQFHD